MNREGGDGVLQISAQISKLQSMTTSCRTGSVGFEIVAPFLCSETHSEEFRYRAGPLCKR